MYFPISEIEVAWYIPPLASCILSFFTSMSGFSGAFLLLPFQIEFLNYTSPAVSATNQFYNIISIPSGLYIFTKEKRLHKHLAKILCIGALPGILFGSLVRSYYLTDIVQFKKFAACLLLYIAFLMLRQIGKKKNMKLSKTQRDSFRIIECNYSHCIFEFADVKYFYDCKKLLYLSAIVSFFGSIYGIGGGALLAPFLITFFKLPIYIISAATLACTLFSSIVGVLLYYIFAFISPESNLSPDIFLGTLFGIGGFIGMNIGAKLQKHLSTTIISLIIVSTLFITAFIWLKPLIGL